MNDSIDTESGSLKTRLIVIGVLAVIGGLGYILKTWWDTPAALLGNVADPPGEVHVILDNGKMEQYADDVDGFFRFEGVKHGEHRLRFEYREFHPSTVDVQVFRHGDNKLTKEVVLVPKSASSSPPEIEFISVAYVPSYSADGLPPSLKVQAVLDSWTLLPIGQAPATVGWIFLGEMSNGAWTNQALDVGNTYPSTGQLLFHNAPIMIWADAPEKAFFRGYEMGLFEGVVTTGAKITFLEHHVEVGDGKVWAQVQIAE